MNDVVKNIQTFIELLQSSCTNDVELWDIAALHRSFKWAKYFEGLYIKIKDKPRTIEEINKKLKLICCLPGAAIGDKIYNVQDLRQSQRLLLKNLIQNPTLPRNLFGEVLKQYGNLTEENTNTGLDQFIHDASKIIQSKSSRIFLQQTMMKMKSVEDQNQEDLLTIQGLKEEQTIILNARLLRMFIILHLSNSPCPQNTNEYLDQVLHKTAAKPNGMRIIAMTISTLPTENKDIEKQHIDSCEHLIFDWIQQNKAKYLHQQKDE